ncbi:MAG: transcription antitermination factor NusB [Minisyncoccales bacterium]
MGQRRLARVLAFQTLFVWDFFRGRKKMEEIIKETLREKGEDLRSEDFFISLVQGVIKHIAKIDEIIKNSAPQWPLEQMPLVDRNVLRLGIFELVFGDKKAVPAKVAINETIELGKMFGSSTTGKFVNGVLGTVFKIMKSEEENEKNDDEKKEKNS